MAQIVRKTFPEQQRQDKWLVGERKWRRTSPWNRGGAGGLSRKDRVCPPSHPKRQTFCGRRLDAEQPSAAEEPITRTEELGAGAEAPDTRGEEEPEAGAWAPDTCREKPGAGN